MSETQAKNQKMDMKISRKTINAIHQSKSAANDFNAFQESQNIAASAPVRRTLNLKISRKKDVIRNTGLQNIKNTSNSSDSTLVDELLADLTVNSHGTKDYSSDNLNNKSSDIFKKLDSLDSDDFSIANNDIPVDFESIDKVYGTNNISAIKTIKGNSKTVRAVKGARRGIVKKQPEAKVDDDKPYYIVVDTDIDYNEIMSRPSKKASEMIDQNSAFFYNPNVFAESDIRYVDVDLSADYGGDYLLENYIAPDNGLKLEFLGGSDDHDYFKDEKEKNYSTRRNTYILEFHEADDIDYGIQDVQSSTTANTNNNTDDANTSLMSDELLAEVLSADSSAAPKNMEDEENINNLGNLDGVDDNDSVTSFDSFDEFDNLNNVSAASAVDTKSNDSHKSSVRFASSIFKTFNFDDSRNAIRENIAPEVSAPVAETKDQNYVEKIDEPASPVVNIEAAPLPQVTDVLESHDISSDAVTPFDMDINLDYSSVLPNDDELEMLHLRTSTTFVENDYEDYEMDDSNAANDSNADYSLDDNSGIDFVDEDVKLANKENEEEIDTVSDVNTSQENLDVNDINLDDISLDDLDLTDIDLTNDNALDNIATPTSQDITDKLTDQLSSLDKDLQDELLSEVLLSSDDDASLLDDINIEDIADNDAETIIDNPTDDTDDADNPIEDNEFYKLINSLSDTITNLENSITMPEQEELKKEEPKKTGKAINILINKDDIFSISIENETYDIVADFTNISVISQNINISTPKNNFFTKIGNKYIEIHRKEGSNFVVYTNFEDIEFENAINNISFAKKKDKIELNIKESFKLASVDNKVSLSILNTNIAKIKKPGENEEETEEDNQNSICDNDVLTINEETQKVYLPYKIEDVMNYIKNTSNDYHTIKEVVEGEYTIPMSTFKPPIVSRFKEAYNFMRTKEKSSVYAALDLALELMFNANLNPAIIRACSNLRELNVYLDCLYENELEKFDCFKIVYKVLPRIQ